MGLQGYLYHKKRFMLQEGGRSDVGFLKIKKDRAGRAFSLLFCLIVEEWRAGVSPACLYHYEREGERFQNARFS